MPSIEFTQNHEDVSSDQRLQFKFHCERCGDCGGLLAAMRPAGLC